MIYSFQKERNFSAAAVTLARVLLLNRTQKECLSGDGEDKKCFLKVNEQ